MLKTKPGSLSSIQHFLGLIWPLKGSAQKGEGINVLVALPSPNSCVLAPLTHLTASFKKIMFREGIGS